MLQLIDRAFIEVIRWRCLILIMRLRQGDLEAEQVVRTETGIYPNQLLKAPDQERAKKENDDSGGDFRRNKRASAPASSACTAPVTETQGFCQRIWSLAQWQQAKENSSEKADARGGQQNRYVELDRSNHRWDLHRVYVQTLPAAVEA